jgi:hypothetical protein
MRVLEGGLQVSVQGDTSHLGPVAVVVVLTPSWITGMHVAFSQRMVEERVASVDAGVEYAGRRSLVRRGLRPGDEIGNPVRLVDL